MFALILVIILTIGLCKSPHGMKMLACRLLQGVALLFGTGIGWLVIAVVFKVLTVQ